jgi:cell division protease FtsH
VFLGEELIHTRDHSEETAWVIDEEVCRVLAGQADGPEPSGPRHRGVLAAVAAALIERETPGTDEIARLVECPPAVPALTVVTRSGG